MMNLHSKRMVVSFGGKERGKPVVVEEAFPGNGTLDRQETLKYAFMLGWYWLTQRKVMTLGELGQEEKYLLAPKAKAFFQLLQDLHELGLDE